MKYLYPDFSPIWTPNIGMNQIKSITISIIDMEKMNECAFQVHRNNTLKRKCRIDGYPLTQSFKGQRTKVTVPERQSIKCDGGQTTPVSKRYKHHFHDPNQY